MAKSKSKAIPKSKSLDQLVEFFDTHDLGDYWDKMPKAHFDIAIKKRTHVFTLDEDIAERVDAIAKEKNVPSERLINTWLKEKVAVTSLSQ